MMKKILILLVLLSTLVFADTKTIYAWGYGDLVAEALQSVKYIFGIAEFRDIWKIAMAIALISALVTSLSANPDYMKIPKVIIIATGVYTVFMASHTDVWIEDKVDPNKSAMVVKVPWAVAYPFSFFSTMEYRMGAMYEVSTDIPTGMSYSNSGFMTPISVFDLSTKHIITTPNLYQNFEQYIIECVMPDINSGYKDIMMLAKTTNLFAYMGDTHPARYLLQRDDKNETYLATCPDAYSKLKGDLEKYTSFSGAGMEHLGESLGGVASDVVYSQLGQVNSFLIRSSKSAQQVLMQNTTMNMFSESFNRYAAINGMDSSVGAFGLSQASAAATAQMAISGALGAKFIPVMKGILTVIIIGLTPLLMLLMITPIGVKTMIGYILMLAWLACWHFGDVILNHIITIKVKNALIRYGDMAFTNKGAIDSSITDWINMASSMYWSIPTIAMIIVTGFSLTSLAALNNSLSMKLDRTATATGGAVSSGNLSMGNVSHNNYNANTTKGMLSYNTGFDYQHNDTYSNKSGSSVERHNSLNERDGEIGNMINTGINKLNSANDVVSNLGNKIKSDSTYGTAGSLSRLEDGSFSLNKEVTSTMDNGVTAITKSGATFDSTGNIITGTTTIGNNTYEYRDGKEISRSYEGIEGKATVTQNADGTSYFSVTSQDGTTEARGIINKDGSKTVDYARVDGEVWDKSRATEQSRQEQVSAKTSEILMQQYTQGSNSSKTRGDNESFGISTSAAAQVKAGFELPFSIASVQGIAEVKGSTNNEVSVSYANGKTEVHSLSAQQMEDFTKAQNQATSEVQRESRSSDQMRSYVEKQLNSGNETIIQDLNNIARNKDSIGGVGLSYDNNIPTKDNSSIIKSGKESIQQKYDNSTTTIQEDLRSIPAHLSNAASELSGITKRGAEKAGEVFNQQMDMAKQSYAYKNTVEAVKDGKELLDSRKTYGADGNIRDKDGNILGTWSRK